MSLTLRIVVALATILTAAGFGPVADDREAQRPAPRRWPAVVWPITYTYEVRGRQNASDLEAFAALAAETLTDARGWGLGGSIRFVRVPAGGHFTLWLSAASSVPGFGPPCDSTYSCSVGRDVIINETRWHQASPAWNGAGGSLRDYRHMVVNHEVGHWLGFGHTNCGGTGQPAPVMQQQSISLQGCAPNGWPLAWERQIVALSRGVPILPGGPGPTATALANRDGRLEVFAVGGAGQVAHRWQLGWAPGWSGWFGLGGNRPRQSALDGGRNVDGRLEVFQTSEAGRLLHNFQWPVPGGWSGWFELGSSVASPPSVGQNADGRFEIFAIGTGGQLLHTWQLVPNGGWSGTFSLGSGFADQPGVGWTTDNRQAVFAVGADRRLRGRIQIAPNGAWSGTTDLGGPVTGRPAVGRNADGRLEVFVTHADGRLHHAWQNPGGGWSSLFPISGPVIGQAPAIGRNADGRLEVFVTAPDGVVHHAWQAAVPGGWTPLFAMGGAAAGPPAVRSNADGRLELFVMGRDGQLHHNYQLWPNGPWHGMASLGRP